VRCRPLSELRAADEAQFGGKSAGLGELIAAGLAVPPGFAVSSAAGEGDLDEVVAAYRAMGEPPVAVRSSAIGEDSAEASFAGLQDTFLWVRGAERVLQAVRDCWASLHNTEAVSYRERIGFQGEPAMGVTVQEMVDAAVSGVMFTCNPVSGDPSMIAINASWGLGLAVVGGEVTPDDYLVSKITREVVREHIHEKHIEYVPGEHGRGAVTRNVEPERQTARTLDKAAIERLVEVGRGIERHFGSHQDIEWAIARGEAGELFVVQSRPVTTLPERETKPAPPSALSLVMNTFGVKTDDGA
jgi:pyruvate, water dikinase